MPTRQEERWSRLRTAEGIAPGTEFEDVEGLVAQTRLFRSENTSTLEKHPANYDSR